MTNRFDSFDSSAMNSYKATSLDARNPAELGLIALIVFIDESIDDDPQLNISYSDHPIFWDEDMALWQAHVDRLKDKAILAGGVMQPFFEARQRAERFQLWPDSVGVFPSNLFAFRFFVGRPGDLAIYQELFTDMVLRANLNTNIFQLRYFGYAHDNSGSLDVGELEPTLTTFLDDIATKHPEATFLEPIIFNNERWIQALSLLADQIP